MNQTVAGIIFLLIWIAAMVLWGNSKDIQPNLGNEQQLEPCKIQGHPLWTDC